jgi:hypothetical protein
MEGGVQKPASSTKLPDEPVPAGVGWARVAPHRKAELEAGAPAPANTLFWRVRGVAVPNTKRSILAVDTSAIKTRLLDIVVISPPLVGIERIVEESWGSESDAVRPGVTAVATGSAVPQF